MTPATTTTSRLRQIRILFALWFRYMRRRAPRLGATPRRGGIPTFLLLTLFSWGYVGTIIWSSVTHTIEKNPDNLALHLIGNLLLGLAAGWVRAGGANVAQRLRDDGMLDSMPIHLVSRSALLIVDGLLFGVVGIVTVLAVATSRHLGPAWTTLFVLIAATQFIALFLVGQAAIAWFRVLDMRWLVRSTFIISIVFMIVGFPLSMSGAAMFMQWHVPGSAALASAWLSPGPTTLIYGACVAAAAVIALFLLEAADRVGFDRLQINSGKKHRDRGHATRARLEWRLMMRQGGPMIIVLGVLFVVGVTALVIAAGKKHEHDAMPVFIGLAIYLPALFALTIAGRALRGDLMARPMLAPLPMSPHDTLAGKVSALRLALAPFYVALVVLAVASIVFQEPSLAYRALLAMIGLHVAIEGALAVAFLSNGAGVAGGGGLNLGAQLLMIPLIATALSPSSWTATTSLIAVVAVSWEAQRAARLSVRWIDDSADDTARETTVWRALLVLTTFFAIGALSQRLADMFEMAAGWQLVFSYTSSALVLGLLMLRNRRRFPSLRISPSRLWAWPLGALLGGISGLVGLQFAKLILPFIDKRAEAASDLQAMSTAQATALFLCFVVAAPLAEETFFRGWLQNAIADDLPPLRRRWAFVIAAGAFALSHIGTYGVPQLVLGLVAGGLFAAFGGLGPGMLAHAVHNGVVVLLGGTQ